MAALAEGLQVPASVLRAPIAQPAFHTYDDDEYTDSDSEDDDG
jgi:hypothetical protein